MGDALAAVPLHHPSDGPPPRTGEDKVNTLMLKLFFDGGCRPNPGAMETAVVTRGIVHHATGLGIGSNDEAEWLAARRALAVARDLGAIDIVLVGDSARVVAQANGAPCRSAALAAHRDAFRAEAAGFARVRIRHVRRAQNLAGTALEKAHGRR